MRLEIFVLEKWRLFLIEEQGAGQRKQEACKNKKIAEIENDVLKFWGSHIKADIIGDSAFDQTVIGIASRTAQKQRQSGFQKDIAPTAADSCQQTRDKTKTYHCKCKQKPDIVFKKAKHGTGIFKLG